MSTKIKTIRLIYVSYVFDTQQPGWRVEQATDSTEYNPGITLNKKEVDELCGAKDLEGYDC